MKQTTFASLSYAAKKKRTRREKFLAQMGKVVPWHALEGLIELHYPSSGRRGRPPIGLKAMLRIHFLQQWYGYNDSVMEDALYEIESMRLCAGIELNEDAIPDETTILKFRRLLERHDLAGKGAPGSTMSCFPKEDGASMRAKQLASRLRAKALT